MCTRKHILTERAGRRSRELNVNVGHVSLGARESTVIIGIVRSFLLLIVWRRALYVRFVTQCRAGGGDVWDFQKRIQCMFWCVGWMDLWFVWGRCLWKYDENGRETVFKQVLIRKCLMNGPEIVILFQIFAGGMIINLPFPASHSTVINDSAIRPASFVPPMSRQCVDTMPHYSFYIKI